MALEHISIRQGNFYLQEIDLYIPTGAYAVLMGQTGCGKTTLLELFCGLRNAVSGRVLLMEEDVTHLPPGARCIGYVPQDHVLFPRMTVREQLGFAPRIQKWSFDDTKKRVDELASRLGIAHLLDRFPQFLSGGESQRVALGRALAVRPSILCLDEPLSALDEDTHDDVMELLSSLHTTENLTILHITHSRREAGQLATQRHILRDNTLHSEEISPC